MDTPQPSKKVSKPKESNEKSIDIPSKPIKSDKVVSKVEKQTKTTNNKVLEEVVQKKKRYKKPKSVNQSNIHVASLLNHKLQGIQCVALNQDHTLLAVSRSNSLIEIWQTSYSKRWVCITTLPGRDDTTVHALAWVRSKDQDRLFSAGLHGYVTEWDLSAKCPLKKSEMFGGAIWSMDYHDGKFALACENARIVIMDLDLNFIKSFGPNKLEDAPKIDGINTITSNRLLSVKWSFDGNLIFVGGITGVYCYDMSQYRMKFKISIESGIVWSVLPLKDDMLVVGDSQGKVHFCDSKFGVILKSFDAHSYDVTSLACTSDSNFVASSGIDGKITMFKKTKNWTKLHAKRPTNHDVRSIAIINDRYIISGSADSRISLTTIPDKMSNFTENAEHFVNIIPGNFVRHNQRRFVCNMNDNTLRVYNLPKTELELAPTEILHIKPKSIGGWHLSDFDILGDQIVVIGVDFCSIFSTSSEEIVQLKFGGSKVCFVNHDTICLYDNSKRVVLVNLTSKSQIVLNVSKDKVSRWLPSSVTNMMSNGSQLIIAQNTNVDIFAQDQIVPSHSYSFGKDNYIYKMDFLHKEKYFYCLCPNNQVFKVDVTGKEKEEFFNETGHKTLISVGHIESYPKNNYVQYQDSIFPEPKGEFDVQLGLFRLETTNEFVVIMNPWKLALQYLDPVVYRHRYGT